MRILNFILSIFVFINVSQAQMSDLEIAQNLISKYHVHIRESLNELGLTYVQKKQMKIGENEMKFVFIINGTENNNKPWDIYTEKVTDDSVRISKIIIKFYYKNKGDIIEFDKFKKQHDQIVNRYFISYEKSEGTRQAHVQITSQEVFNHSNNIVKSSFLNFASSSSHKLYMQLIKEHKQNNVSKYYLKVYVEDLYTCVGLPTNRLILELYNNKSITLKEENTSSYCSKSAESNFYLKETDIETLKKNNPIIFRLIQDKEYNEFKTNNPQLLTVLINMID